MVLKKLAPSKERRAGHICSKIWNQAEQGMITRHRLRAEPGPAAAAALAAAGAGEAAAVAAAVAGGGVAAGPFAAVAASETVPVAAAAAAAAALAGETCEGWAEGWACCAAGRP
eukprot:1161575-Pelagomonas_calceolata.AAC.16